MQAEEEKELVKTIVKVTRYTVYLALIAAACIAILVISLVNNGGGSVATRKANESAPVSLVTASSTPAASAETTSRAIPAGAWKALDESTIPPGKTGDMIRYGKELLVHTAQYFGPHGTVAHITNGMNCQNCHLAAGTKLFANDYAGFIASYPKLSGRSGKVESASERIAECFERSLAGKVPDYRPCFLRM